MELTEWLSGYRHRVFILTRARSPSREAASLAAAAGGGESPAASLAAASQHVEEATSLGTDRPDI